MASKAVLELALKSIAEGRGFDDTNAEITKTIFNAQRLSQKQYDVVVKAVEQGRNLNQISGDLKQLEQDEKAVAQAAKEAESATGGLGQGLQGVQSVLGALGLAVTSQQLLQFANNSREAARAETDALNTLKAAAGTTVDYKEALQLGREATMGMASDQQIASSEATLLGAGLADTASEAAGLTSAGSILSGVFSNVGGSMEKFNMLLSSGSPMLLNNFGLTKEMVAAKQEEIEATTKLSGEEAKQQALKEVLIAQAQKYKGALSEETIATQQAQAAQQNFTAAFGNLINEADRAGGITTKLTGLFNQMAQGAKTYGQLMDQVGDLSATDRLSVGLQVQAGVLAELTGVASAHSATILEMTEAQRTYAISIGQITQADVEAAQAAENWVSSTQAMGISTQQAATAEEQAAAAAEQEKAALDNTVSSLNAMGFSAVGAAEAHDPLIQKLIEAGIEAVKTADALKKVSDAQAVDSGYANMTNRDADALRQLYQARAKQPETQLEFNNQEEERKRQEAEKTAQQQEKAADRAAKATVKAFDKVGSQISSAVSSAMSQNTTDIMGLLGIKEEDGQNANETMRRFAAVATGGLGNEWATRLATEFQGVSGAQAFVKAVQSKDEAGAIAEARKLALHPILEMYNADAIAQGLAQDWQDKQLAEQLNAKVNSILGKQGLPALAEATNQISQAVTSTGEAAGTVGTSMATVAGDAKTTGGEIKTAFTEPIEAIDILLQRILNLNSYLRETISIAKGAADAIGGLNPPAAGAGGGGNTGVENQMGGVPTQ